VPTFPQKIEWSPIMRFASFVVLSASLIGNSCLAQSPAAIGVWQGAAISHGQQVPITVRISGSNAALKVALLNGPAEHPDESPASSASFDGTHLVATYDYFARKLDATLADGKLTGTYGSVSATSKSAPIPVALTRVPRLADPASAANPPNIEGSWEIVTHSAKGESAWEFRVDPPTPNSPVIKTVIQRIDGDTGGLWGTWNGTSYTVGHFTAAGAALYSVTPQADGTLLVKNLLAAPTPTPTPASAAPAPADLIARRSEDARKQNLPAPTDPTEQTRIKDPAVPLAFSFPDLSGKTVSNTDAQFQGKVVIVAIGGSWCPNCHDEAPFLVSLYRKYHAKGLEIVNLDFEQGDDPATDTARLHAFIAHYGIPYTVLTAGRTDQLNEKIPQGVNLNCWPTSFFIGRDGLVKEVHAGFAGPGNTVGHEALVRETTELVENLLAHPAPSESASR
jgi:thiol-disulfide isomerase/thioredoxin